MSESTVKMVAGNVFVDRLINELTSCCSLNRSIGSCRTFSGKYYVVVSADGFPHIDSNRNRGQTGQYFNVIIFRCIVEYTSVHTSHPVWFEIFVIP